MNSQSNQQKNKIIQVNSSSDTGGGSQVMWDISFGLNQFFDFVILAPKGFFMDKYKEAGFKVNTLTGIKFLKIRKEIKTGKPAIINAHGTRAAIWARLAVLFSKERPKIVYTLHGFHILRKNFILRFVFLRLEKFLNHFTDILVCVSQADKELVLGKKVINLNKIKVIRNGIELEKFNVSPELAEAKRNESGLKDNFVLVSVGRLHPQKDFSTLIKAVNLVEEQIINLKVLIIGDGPLNQDLKREVGELGLMDKILFLGERKDVPEFIAMSEGVILSTNWEGLALVPLEAGAAGKAVIASRVGGVEESILDGETGFLFEPGSEKDLADKILMLYQSKELRKKIGEMAFQFVSDNFSKERMVKEHKQLYQNLL